MKICEVGAEFSVRTDGRTDVHTYMTKLIVGFHSFVNTPKSELN
jgi:hypothetical protein